MTSEGLQAFFLTLLATRARSASSSGLLPLLLLDDPLAVASSATSSLIQLFRPARQPRTYTFALFIPRRVSLRRYGRLPSRRGRGRPTHLPGVASPLRSRPRACRQLPDRARDESRLSSPPFASCANADLETRPRQQRVDQSAVRMREKVTVKVVHSPLDSASVIYRRGGRESGCEGEEETTSPCEP